MLNKDTLIEGATLNFQGLFIGNAALNVDDYWRTKVIIKYFESHYFFGPEILNLIKTCKYSAEDDRNPSCQIGLQLADNVPFWLFRLSKESISITQSVFATTFNLYLSLTKPRQPKEENIGILLSSRDSPDSPKKNQDVILMIQVWSSFSMILKSKNNSMLDPPNGLLAVILFMIVTKRELLLSLFSKLSERQVSKWCSSLETLML